ncbi:RNA polymerase III subunit GL b isoform X3 [Siniperca chuatsi]|nr:RNA polymerase III subunit GL b isoform X3 [Siniperca chuatsi]
MEQKPLPLAGGEEAEYLLALKQEFRGAMKTLPCFIQPAAAHRDVERYSDKYHSSEQTDGLMDWTPDWKRFPKELRVHVKKPARDGVSAAGGRSDRLQPGQKKKRVKEKEEVLLKLERRRRRNRRKRRPKERRSTTRKSLRRRRTTSCPTLITERSSAETVTTTWTRLFTETPALSVHSSASITFYSGFYRLRVCSSPQRKTVQQPFDVLNHFITDGTED